MTKKKEKKEISAEPQVRSLIPRVGISLADHQGEWLEDEHVEAKAPEDLSAEQIQGYKRDELFHSFARQIAKVKRLSDEEEYNLGQRIKKFNDKEAKKKLVLHNMRLALKMAHQYRREWTSLMDLVQEASAGMAIAAQKWDPDMGTKFGTYAAYWIRAQLTKFLMTNARLIHTGNTRAGRKLYYSLPQIRRKLLLAGENPTAEAIAKEVGEDPKEVELILARLQSQEASLSSPLDYQSDNGTLEDTLASSIQNPESQATRNEVERVIQDLVSQFEKTIKDERDLAIWRENLMTNEPINLVDLGKRYHVSKQRMGQLATRLKRAFRRHIIEQLGPTTQLSWLFRED